MGLDIWFREDVARILAAACETRRSTARAAPPLDPDWAEAYGQGFDDALAALAVAFGLRGSHPRPPSACSVRVSDPCLEEDRNPVQGEICYGP
jgi:hypothetical protein